MLKKLTITLLTAALLTNVTQASAREILCIPDEDDFIYRDCPVECPGECYYSCRNAACLAAGIIIGTALFVGMVAVVINESNGDSSHSSH